MVQLRAILIFASQFFEAFVVRFPKLISMLSHQ